MFGGSVNLPKVNYPVTLNDNPHMGTWSVLSQGGFQEPFVTEDLFCLVPFKFGVAFIFVYLYLIKVKGVDGFSFQHCFFYFHIH